MKTAKALPGPSLSQVFHCFLGLLGKVDKASGTKALRGICLDIVLGPEDGEPYVSRTTPQHPH
jgi:hypothetical protein